MDRYPKDKTEALLAAMAAFYQDLSQLQNVLIVKSLPNFPSRDLDPSNPEDDLECSFYSNFLRVGFFQKADSKLSPEGRSYKTSETYWSQRRNRKCADVFVNGGFDANDQGEITRYGEHPFLHRYWGLYEVPETEAMSTSWATPLALSYVIFFQNNFYDEYGKMPSLQQMKDGISGGGKKPMIDPLLLNLFELYVR